MTRSDIDGNTAFCAPPHYLDKFPVSGRLILAAVLCFVALPAHANAGTPFMWLSAFYVLFANVLIGLFEGVVVKLVFRECKLRVLLPLFIVANYASMFVGMMPINWIRSWLVACMASESLVFAAPKIIALLAAAAFIITIVVEWPFCWFAIRKRQRAWTKALALSLLLQTLSYIPIVAWWGWVSSYDMYVSGSVVEDTAFTKNAGFTVYTLDDEALWKQNLDGSGRTRLADAPKDADMHWSSLVVDGDKVGVVASGYVLKAAANEERTTKRSLVEVPLDDCAKSVMAAPFLDYNKVLSWPTDDKERLAPFYWELERIGVDYRLPDTRSWSAIRYPFGLENPDVARVDVDGSRFAVGLETPLFSLGQGVVFLLPNGEMTAKLGGSVVLVDIHSRTVGVLAQADAYLVVPDEAHAKALLPVLEKEREAEERKERQSGEAS